MARWENQLPSFFKIFHSDMSSTLRIPSEFVKTHERMLLEISLLQAGSEKSWDVKVRKQRNGQLCITCGWHEFVEDNQLSEWEFLVFILASKSTLQVMIYGTECYLRERSNWNSYKILNSTTCIHAEPGGGQNLQTKRKRGRPRKYPISGGEQYFQSKRGRGRPRKDVTTSVSAPMMRECKPSFFKILVRDFASKLDLPPAFMHKYGESLPGNVKLRTDSGKTWSVEVKIDDEECCSFSGGWNRFAKDIELDIGEFLVFWLDVDGSTLDVAVYGTSGCKRTTSSSTRSASDEESLHNHELSRTTTDTDREFAPESSDHPCMEILMTKSAKSRMSLTTEFAEAAKLNGKRAAVLEFPPRQRYWPVILQERPFSNFNLDLAAGWHDFWNENNLEVGQTYCFEFNPTRNVIQVKKTRVNN